MLRRPFGAKIRSKTPPTPPAPSQVVLMWTRDPPFAGDTVQVLTIEELASFSTRVSAEGALTENRQSRIRLLVAASFQCTTVPAPWPPSRTSYSPKCSVSILERTPV